MDILYNDIFLQCLFYEKKEPQLVRPYKVPLYPFIPMIALLGGLFIVFNTLFTQPILALCGIGLTAIGLPIYFKMRHKHINVKREN